MCLNIAGGASKLGNKRLLTRIALLPENTPLYCLSSFAYLTHSNVVYVSNRGDQGRVEGIPYDSLGLMSVLCYDRVLQSVRDSGTQQHTWQQRTHSRPQHVSFSKVLSQQCEAKVAKGALSFPNKIESLCH